MKLRSYPGCVALAVILIGGVVIDKGPANAQSTAGRQESGVLNPLATGGSAAPAPLVKHVLVATFFDTTSPGASASCNSVGCSAYAPIYLEKIICPRASGATCTYQITIQSQNAAGSNDGTVGEEGVYQFLVDGKAATPGPLGAGCACYTWSGAGNGASLPIRGTSYSVTATVTNSSANQSHSIKVNIGCNELNANNSGCFAASGFANLSVATYGP